MYKFQILCVCVHISDFFSFTFALLLPKSSGCTFMLGLVLIGGGLAMISVMYGWLPLWTVYNSRYHQVLVKALIYNIYLFLQFDTQLRHSSSLPMIKF